MTVELYKHNKIAYEKVLEHLKKSNRTCVIHPTGSGKSFISLKWLYDNSDKKCLFMCPTDAIKDQLLEHIKNEGLDKEKDFPNLDIVLYQSIHKIKDNHYDNIVFDEFHRIGAKTWGEGVKDLLSNNPNAKILGLTATPIRYLDNKRNMAEEIFHNDISSYISLSDALLMGILKSPVYIDALYSYNDELINVENKIKDKNMQEDEEIKSLYKLLKDKVSKAKGLDEIFKENMKSNGKYIVFCKDINSLTNIMGDSDGLFSKINKLSLFYVHSKKPRIFTSNTIRNFEENNDNNLKLLFAVDMLNEGVHIKGIDGVIMFRQTISPNLYLQQLGRALSVDIKDESIVFDIVNNFKSLDQADDLRNELIEKANLIKKDREEGKKLDEYLSNEKIDKILQNFKVLKEYQEINEILKKIDSMITFTWNDWFKLAKAYYETDGNLNIPISYRTLDGKTEIKLDDERYTDAIKLGYWIGTQRKEYKKENHGSLTEERIQKLELIGMIWNIHETTWNENYELAKAYYEFYGNLNIPSRYRTNDGKTEITSNDERYTDAIKLGVWISDQRSAYKKGELSPERLKKLESIGMIWNAIETTWNKNYELAKAYYEFYGNLNIPYRYRTLDGKTEIKSDDSGYTDAIKLGKWISNQRSEYKKENHGSLTEERIQKLESIGMIWNTKKNTNEMKLLIDKFHIKHKADIQKLPYKVVLLKINFLISNNLPIEDENGLNKIFFMSNLDMREEYGISLEGLMGHTKEKKL